MFPVKLEQRQVARVVVAEGGQPLRSFADQNGHWRFTINVDKVSPYYLQALINYEDRWFYLHPGVNPLSLLRASWQFLKNGRIISGASTLTMQVARLRYPHNRGLIGKFKQILRALQIDWHYSKKEILNYYLNHAPFGGTIEGVQAASYSYFGYGAEQLTRAQAALLAVLPQAPSRNRPDRYPQRAQVQRDKVLNRLQHNGIYTEQELEDALLENVEVDSPRLDTHAHLLARRLLQQQTQRVADGSRINTSIDLQLQINLERLAKDYAASLPQGVSLAILVMEHGSGLVKAYIGSADFSDRSRFSYVDMVRGIRSPGSTLKPFIYALAMDEALVHSESLLMDVPLAFGDYRPNNFNRGFSGPIALSEALTSSLNIPAVQVLEQLGPAKFYAKLQSAGAGLHLPKQAKPNLSLALGGTSLSLENLVRLYSSLANEGNTIKPRFNTEEPLIRRNLLSPESAWIVRTLLENKYRANNYSRLAIKTGTSYGNRDAWAIAVGKYHTLGVWVGNPAGHAIVGQLGEVTAVPLLTNAARYIKQSGSQVAHSKPETVTSQTICWPQGYLKSQSQEQRCSEAKEAWLIDGVAPATLMATADNQGLNALSLHSYWVAEDSGLRVNLGCQASVQKQFRYLWPDPLQAWLADDRQNTHLIPAADPRCELADSLLYTNKLRIRGLQDGHRIHMSDHSRELPKIKLRAVGGQADWYWFVNGDLLAEHGPNLDIVLKQRGQYQVSVLDQAGMTDSLSFWLE